GTFTKRRVVARGNPESAVRAPFDGCGDVLGGEIQDPPSFGVLGLVQGGVEGGNCFRQPDLEFLNFTHASMTFLPSAPGLENTTVPSRGSVCGGASRISIAPLVRMKTLCRRRRNRRTPGCPSKRFSPSGKGG